MNRGTAEQVSLLLLRHGAELDSSVMLIRDRGDCDADEYHNYRRAIAQVMGDALTVMNAIYREHPDLKPKQLGGPYEIDERIYQEAQRIGASATDESK